MKKIIIYCTCAICLFSAGCFDDKSGPENIPVASIAIDGLEEEYNVISFRDNLTIEPSIISDGKDMEYEYLWTLFAIGSPSFGKLYQVDTLGKSEKLDYMVEYSPGSYKLVLRVTDAKNKYTIYKTAMVNVNTMFTTGHFLLKETAEGNTDLDFFSSDGIGVPDLLLQQTGAPIKGKPTRLGFFPKYSYKYADMKEPVICSALLPMGGKEVKIMKIMDMAQIYDHDDMFYGKPADEIPLTAACDLFSRPHYISSKGHYMSSQMPGWGKPGTGLFGFATQPKGKNANLSANSVIHSTTNTNTYNFYDENSNRLFYVNFNGDALEISSSKIHLDSLAQFPRDILFMGTSGWAVFWDEADHTSRHIYKLNLRANTDPVTETYKIDPELNFCKAIVYGSNKLEDKNMLYAGVGDQLYLYNAETRTEKNVTPPEFGSGETITMITHKPDAPKDYLMIGTFKDGKYKVYMYTLAAGEPYGKPAIVLTGPGKVVDMQYVNPSLSRRYECNY